ncbi:Non-specific lipid-transfer protein [Bienertia sinuspersici]
MGCKFSKQTIPNDKNFALLASETMSFFVLFKQ